MGCEDLNDQVGGNLCGGGNLSCQAFRMDVHLAILRVNVPFLGMVK